MSSDTHIRRLRASEVSALSTLRRFLISAGVAAGLIAATAGPAAAGINHCLPTR